MRILPITQEENYVAERTYVAKVIFLIHFIYFEKKKLWKDYDDYDKMIQDRVPG